MRVHTAVSVLACAALLAGCSEDEPPLEIALFEASAASVDAGSPVTLRWRVEGADSVTITQSPGETIASEADLEGELETPALNEDSTFTLAATRGEETVTESVNVTVIGVNIVRFEAQPATIGRGDTAELSWRLGGSMPSDVRVFVGDDETQTLFDPASMLDRTGQVTVTPEQTTTYTLRAQAGGVVAMDTVTVTVMSMRPTIETFEAVALVDGTPQVVTQVAAGAEIQLRWEVSNVNEVRVTANGQVRRDWNSMGATSGNVSAQADQEQNVFLLEARNGPEPGDLAMQELVVTTAERPTIDTFEVSPMTYARASTVATARWATQGAVGTILLLDGQPVPSFPRTASGTFMFDVTGEATVELIARNDVGDTTETRQIRFGFADPEPNDSTAQAIPIAGDGVAVRGALPSGDADFYSFTVPDGGFVVARAEAGEGASCDALDPSLTLYDASGTELGRRDRAGLTRCAEILPPEDAGFAENLAGGTYYIRVGRAAGAMTERYSLEVETFTLPPPLSNVTTNRVGDPSWEVSDFIQVSIPWGASRDMFPELTANVQRIFGPRHRAVNPNIFTWIARPNAPAASSFGQELRTMIEVLGLTNKNTFTATNEWTNTSGLLIGYTLTPAATATVGTSADFPTPPGGPIIRNGILAVEVTAGIQLGDEDPLAFPGQPSRIQTDPRADGLSHVNVLHALSPAVFMMPPPLPLDLTWLVSLRDRTMSGWDITFSTTVMP